MRVSDLIDFAEYSVVNVFFNNIFPEDIIAEDPVVIELDSFSQKYYLELKGRRYDIIPVNEDSKREMDSYIAPRGLYIKSYVNKIDPDKRTAYIYIFRFCQRILMPVHNKLKIKVQDSVISKLPSRRVDDVALYLNKHFVLENANGIHEFFAIKKKIDKVNESEQDDFVLVCGKHRMNIKKRDNEYVVTNILRFRKSDSPMIVMAGQIEFVDSTQNARITEAISECIVSATQEGKYTSIWRKYDELENLVCARKAISSGCYKYSSYKALTTDIVTYVFDLMNQPDTDALVPGSDLDVTDNADIKNFYDDPTPENASQLFISMRGQFVGRFAKFEGNKLYIKSDDLTPKKIPSSGYIYKSLQGDIKRMRRREEAQRYINSEQAAMQGLAILLNDGVSIQKSYSDYAPITNEVIRQLTDNSGKKINFNEAQREAIKIAINTPDIALIQGPPGTGKTTVIRAIVARFEEIYKKNNGGKLPRILITSFQHDAVENAIAKIDTLGLPANRVGGRREDADKRKKVFTNWIENTIMQLDEDIKSLTDPTLFVTVEEIRKRYFAWVEKEKDFDEGIEILKQYASSDIKEISLELQSKIAMLLNKKSPIQSSKASPEVQEICTLLSRQRLTPIAFSDDGVSNLKDLIEQLEFFDLDFIKPDYLGMVISSNGADEKSFKKFVSFIEGLKEKYTPITKIDATYGIGDIDWCISELISQKEKAILERIENINEAKAKILMEYKRCLYAETEDIVKKYASVQASTCQQTMETGRGVNNEPFDLVIVDEAARANPSDLFIPLCLGRKIVLVGDQRQLPHMLDPDTLKELGKNTSEETMSFYRKSLFERLFEIFEENDHVHFGTKHTCSLTDQYRMISDISDFVRDKIYLPKVNLKCKTQRQAYDIPYYSSKALVWINAGKEYGNESKTQSKFRDCETDIVISNLKRIFASKVDVCSIGVITFYAEQRDRILRKLDSVGFTLDERNMIEVGTIDAFQGKEFDAVLFTCSRCNDLPVENLQSKVGFLDDDNRMCVALSRARNLLIGIGDSETVRHAKILGEYIDECKNGRGCYING